MAPVNRAERPQRPPIQPGGPTLPDFPLVVTKDEAAQLLKIGPRAIQRLVAQGKLRAVGRNAGRRIIYASILEYLTADSAT